MQCVGGSSSKVRRTIRKAMKRADNVKKARNKSNNPLTILPLLRSGNPLTLIYDFHIKMKGVIEWLQQYGFQMSYIES